MLCEGSGLFEFYGAGSMQLAPVSEAPEGTSQEASLKGLASGTVTRSAESVSSPLPAAAPDRSPSASTEAVAPPALATTAPAKPDQLVETAAVAAAEEPHRGEEASQGDTAPEKDPVAELTEVAGQQEEEGIILQQQQQQQQQSVQELVVGLAAVQLSADVPTELKEQDLAGINAAAAAAEIGRAATPFAAAALQRPEAAAVAAAAPEAPAAAQDADQQQPPRDDSGERPAAAAAALALSHGGSALPFAPSVASALSEAVSLAIPSLPAAGIAPVQARDPPGPLAAAVAESPAATSGEVEETASEGEAKDEGLEGGPSPAALSHSGGSDTSAEQW